MFKKRRKVKFLEIGILNSKSRRISSKMSTVCCLCVCKTQQISFQDEIDVDSFKERRENHLEI